MFSVRALYFGILAAAAVLCSCGSAAPACSADCPNVSGTYLANASSVSADKSSCGSMYFGGMSQQIQLIQNGSALTTTNLFGITGTVDSSLSVFFSSKSVVTNIGSAGTVSLSGIFAGAEGARTFSGSFTFKETSTACAIQVPTTWTQVSP